MAEPLIDEFRGALDALRRLPPEAELDALLRLGLEREALVSVAYRADAVEGRLARMDLDPDVRAVIARAIRWIWREEEGHTLWIRGALLAGGSRVGPLTGNVRGKLMGWVSSRQVHHRWREAPVRRAVAEVLERVGQLLGEVPPAVTAELHYQPFEAFCRFQEASEHTAHLGWARVATLAEAPGCPLHGDVEGFRRLADDEARHARVLAALAAAFDGDRCRLDAAALRASISAVGQRFVAVPDRGRPAWDNPLGKGAPVAVRSGTNPEDLAADVLSAVCPPIAPGTVVALKTTFMLVTRRADPSPGVDVALLHAVVAWLEARGAVVRVLDAPNLYDRFHAGRSVPEVARYLGIRHPVEDCQADRIAAPAARGVHAEPVSRTWASADVRLVLGKLRTHPTLGLYGGLAATEGLGVRHDATVFLDRRTEQSTAMLRVLDLCPPDAVLVDATTAVPDGLMGFFGSAAPLSPGRLYGSKDGVAVDAVLARHCGLRRTPPLLAEAVDWFGDPRPGQVEGTDTPIPGFRTAAHSPRTRVLAALAWPVWVVAGDAALFLPEVDTVAFPPSPQARRQVLLRRVVRRVTRDEAV